MSEVIKSYKGFNRDLTCRGKQYEVGKEYEDEDAEACECGMHACEYPLDCLGYYDPAHSVYHEVEQSGKLSRRSDDSKVASTKMKIGAEISIAGMVKAAIEYTRERIKEENGFNDDYGASSATGDYGASSATWKACVIRSSRNTRVRTGKEMKKALKDPSDTSEVCTMRSNDT